MFVSYTDAALFRRKTFLAMWQSEQRFALIAEALWRDELKGMVTQALDEAPVALKRDILELRPVQATNAVFKLLLAHRAKRSAFEAALNAATKTVQGEWHVTRTQLVAASSGRKAGYLFRDDGRRFMLSHESALVRSAVQVEAERPDISIYYFFENPGFLDQASPGIGPTLELLRGEFLLTFAQWAPAELGEALSAPTEENP